MTERDKADIAAHDILTAVRQLLDASEAPPLEWIQEAQRGLAVIERRATEGLK